jgi:predicted PolB exonuclease-like 3'-5' exonuclease
MVHQSLFVFDIETVMDYEAACNLLDMHGATYEQVKIALENYHLEITDGKNAFFRQPFHKVVAISFLEAEIYSDMNDEAYTLKDLRAGGKIEATEKEIIQGFFQRLSQIKPRLISFNGRTFDLPVLKYRAMKYGVDIGWMYNSGDKWNGYNNRYSLDWHCDLLDALSDFGASARVKMSEVCALLDLPGKLDVDGSQVESLYLNEKLNEIRDYCELDVVNTYLIYLRYMKLTGKLSNINYLEAVNQLKEFLYMKKAEKAHYEEFLNNWKI